MLQLRRVYAINVDKHKMTFSDLAETLGVRDKSLRQFFSRHNWSIHSPENVRKFLATRFSGRKIHRRKQPWRSVEHLQKWRFVKKVRRAEVSPLAEKIKILEEKLAREETENAKLRIRHGGPTAQNLEKVVPKVEEEKLAKKETLIAAKEREIAALMRKNEDQNKKKRTAEPVAELRQARTEPKVQKNIEKNEPQIAENLAPNFGTVPSAEERKEAARARREENLEKIEIQNEPPNSLTHHFSGGEPPALSTETREIKAEKPEHNPPAKGGDPTPQRDEGRETPEIKAEAKIEPATIPVEKIEPIKISIESPVKPAKGESWMTEIAALRAEIREQIGKIEITENTAEEKIEIENIEPAEIPVAEVVAEKVETESLVEEKIETEEIQETAPEVQPTEIPETQEIKAEIDTENAQPAEAESEGREVVEAAPVEVAPVEVSAEQPEPQTAPPNPPN